MARTKFNPLQLLLSTFVTSYTNAGSAGGTFYYLNLGGIKMLWGITGSISSTTSGSFGAVNLPSGFFSSIQYVAAAISSQATFGGQNAAVDSYSTSSVNIKCVSPSGNASQSDSLLIIGT